MKQSIPFLIPLLAIVVTAQSERLQAREPGADLAPLVIVGDSISAGHQNSCLLHAQQPNSYASVMARQARVELPLPLIDDPGLPPCLELVSLEPLVIERPLTMPGLRIDPDVAAHNLSVPGMRVVDALKTVPDDAFHGAFGFPFSVIHQQVLLGNSPGSQIDIAESLEPRTVVLWLGSNDVLWALIAADPAFITPREEFERAFEEIVTRLAVTGATVLVGNVPDVGVIPFTRPVEEFLPPDKFELLGVAAGDSVTLPGLALISDIVEGRVPPPLPPGVVLTAGEADQIRGALDEFNAIIRGQVGALRDEGYPVALVDVNAMLDFVDVNGIVLGSHRLTTDFLGGLFTLDGIHPTNTAHAVLANGFINVLNAQFDARIRPVSVGQLNRTLRNDPLVLTDAGRPPTAPGALSEEILRTLDFIRDPIMAP